MDRNTHQSRRIAAVARLLGGINICRGSGMSKIVEKDPGICREYYSDRPDKY